MRGLSKINLGPIHFEYYSVNELDLGILPPSTYIDQVILFNDVAKTVTEFYVGLLNGNEIYYSVLCTDGPSVALSDDVIVSQNIALYISLYLTPPPSDSSTSPMQQGL